MTIGTLSARILMDASGVKSGMGLTRAEMRLTRQAFIDSTSDVQKLETALGTLASARDKGAFADEQAYAAAIAAVRAELDPTVQAQQAVTAAVDEQLATLQQAIAIYGMSAEELSRYQLAQQGATAEQLAAVQASQQQLQALRDQTAAAQQAAAAANQQAAADEAASAATAAAVDRVTTGLQEEIATRGMSAEETELWKLAQAGASQASLQAVAALQREAQALRDEDAATAAAAAETNRLENEVEQAAQALRMEAATAGMTADQIQVYKLQTQGATAAQVQLIRQLQAQRSAAQQAAGGHKDLAGGLQSVIGGTGGAIPGVSGLTNMLQLGHPVLIAAAVAVGGLVIAYKAARAGLDWYVDGVKEALGSIDKLSKESRTLGTSVQGLREMRFALGEIGGLDVGETDKAMERLTKAIGEANAGGKSQIETFKALGLESAKLAQVGTDEAMKQVADALAGVPSRTEQARLAMELFGREGQSVARAMEGGRAAIEAAGAASREYAGVITEMDAAQIEATNDAWGRVSAAVGSLTEQAAVELAPALQVAAEKVLELLSPQTSTGQSLRMALEQIPPLLALVINLSDVTIGNFQLAQAAVMGLGNVAVQGAAMADRALAAITPGREANAELQAWAADYARQVGVAVQEAAGRIESGMSGGAQQRMGALTKDAADKAAKEASAAAAAKPRDAMYAAMAAAQQQLAEQTKTTTADVRTQIAAVSEWADALQAAGQSVPAMTVSNPLADLAAGVTGSSTEILDQFNQFAAANEKLAGSFGQVRDRLAEQIDYWGMDADAVELAKLAQEGASQQELDELRTLQARLKELQSQKESANTTAVTIDARSSGSGAVMDSLARRRDAAINAQGITAAEARNVFRGTGPEQLAGLPRTPRSSGQPKSEQIPWLEKIAKGIEALVAKEGIVVEEARS